MSNTTKICAGIAVAAVIIITAVIIAKRKKATKASTSQTQNKPATQTEADKLKAV